MSDVEVRIDQKALQDLLTGSDGDVAKMLLRGALQVEGAAKRLCAVDTGRLLGWGRRLLNAQDPC